MNFSFASARLARLGRDTLQLAAERIGLRPRLLPEKMARRPRRSSWERRRVRLRRNSAQDTPQPAAGSFIAATLVPNGQSTEEMRYGITDR